ncbi:MAG: hypothetical protein ACO1RX_15540 [Candidatus Sericytochromatia bacterium]
MLSKLLVICMQDSAIESHALRGIEVEKCSVDLKGPLPLLMGQLIVVDVQHIPTFEQIWSELKRHHSETPLIILVNRALLEHLQSYLADFPSVWDWLPLELETAYLEAKIRQFWQKEPCILLKERDPLDALLHLLNGPISPLEGYLDLLHESEGLSSLSDKMLLQSLFCLRQIKQRLHYLSMYRLLTLKQHKLLIEDFALASSLSTLQHKLSLELPNHCFVVQNGAFAKLWRADKEMLEVLLAAFLRYLTEYYQHVQIELKELSAARLKRRLGYPLEIHQAMGFANIPWGINTDSFLEIQFRFQGRPEMAQFWMALLQQPRVEQNASLELEVLSRLLWEGLRLHHAWIYVETSAEGLSQLSWALPLWPLEE